ncbi:uncharacterized protein LOC120177555 [Hibiscus syriacus]|uniref:uncharacterized protein LOC120177555 n=1 Tax=Hibiscus syriacus TaxID=106335 RepID=UPI0019224C89|nr:uncharacterized protein LOC120177555 [Hibiscus syriacus]
MALFKALYGRKYRTPLCWAELSERCGVGSDLKGNLSLSFIRLYEVLECVGSVAYRLMLPPELERIHDVFHLSMLRKYHSYPSHVIVTDDVKVRADLLCKENLIKILASDVNVLRNKLILLVKVLWRNHNIEEVTWETEESMRA